MKYNQPSEYNKIKALQTVASVLNELKVSSSFYGDKESYNDFEKAYYKIAHSILEYFKETRIHKLKEEHDVTFEKFIDEFNEEFGLTKKVVS